MVPRFKKSRFEPKPIETDYWIDLNENEYGGVFKYYDNNAMVWKQTESITKEREPQFTNSPAYKITSNDINHWNNKVDIADFDALKKEVLDLDNKHEYVTIDTLDYLENALNADLNKKANKSNSLSGYGIKDAYTKKEVDTKFDKWKVDIPENVSHFINDAGYITEYNLSEKLPNNIVSDENYNHTDNNFTNEYKSKLDNLQDDLNDIKYDDTEIKNTLNSHLEQSQKQQQTLLQYIEEQLDNKVNTDQVYSKHYLDELFKSFVTKSHKTNGYIDERPTSDLTAQDTGFIFYDYTVNEPLLWVADEWRILRTNEVLSNFIKDENIIRQVIDWEWNGNKDSKFCQIVKYTGEYSSDMILTVPNVYINMFVTQLGRSMEYWSGKSELITTRLFLSLSDKSLDYEGNPITQGSFIKDATISVQRYRYANRNLGHIIPGIDDDLNDDIYPEDILINYIQNVFGNKVLSPKEPNVDGFDMSLFEEDYNYVSVQSILIPQGLKNIGTGVFMGVKAYENNDLKIPSGVCVIDDYCFYDSSITSVEFPKNPIKLGHYSFSKCPITYIKFPKTMDFDHIKNGGSFGCFSEIPNKVTVEFAEGVKAIPAFCFKNTKLNPVTFPNSLQYVGYQAFYGSLTDAEFDSVNVEYFGVGAFYECTFKSIIVRENTKELSTYLFGLNQQTNLTKFVISPNLQKMHILCIPMNMVNIAAPFVTPPKSKELPYLALYQYGYSINYPTHYENNVPVTPFPDLKLHLSEGLECLSMQSISYCGFSGDLILPESLKYIQSYAVSKNYNFTNTKLRIPKNVQIIGGTTTVWGSICSYQDIQAGLQEQYQPVSKNGYSIINFYDYLEDGGKVSKYGRGTFYQFGCNTMREFEVDPENKWFTAVDGVLFSKDLKRLIAYPCAKGIDTYRVPEGCIYIDSYAFSATGWKKQFEVIKPDGSVEQVTQSWGTIPRDSYCGENPLRTVILSNTVINYSPQEMATLFPTAHFKGINENMLRSTMYGCGIERFLVNDDNPLYKNDGDWLLSKDGTKLQIICEGMKGTHRIPDSVNEIVDGAASFTGVSLTNEEVKWKTVSGTLGTVASQFSGLYLIIPPSVTVMSEVTLFELNCLNKVSNSSVILEEGNPAFIQDPLTGMISRR